MRRAPWLALLVVALPGAARAASPVVVGSVDAGGGVVAGAPALGLDPLLRLRWGDQALDLGASLRFGLDGRLRARDWDEPGDPLQVLRRLSLRAGPVEIGAGDLAGLTFGTGAIFRGYLGNPDPDRHSTGLTVAIRTDAVDVDLAADHLPLVDVLGARVAIRPASLTAPTPGAGRLGLALTLAADLAPIRRGASGYGIGLKGVSPGGPSLGAVALEAEYLLHARKRLRVAPFIVAGALVSSAPSASAGLHAGARAHIAPVAAVAIDVSVAGVLAGAGYLPGVLGPLYRLERHGFPLPRQGAVAAGARPLALALAELPARGMVVADATVRVDPIEVSAGYQSPAGGGAGHRWWLRGALPHLGPVGVGLFAAGDDFAPLLGAVEVTLRFGAFHLRALASRNWATDGTGESPGPYHPVYSFWLAAGVSATATGK